MKKKEVIIQDSFMNILLHKKFKDVEIYEIIKKAKIKSKEFNFFYQNKEQIVISFFTRIDLMMEIKDNLFEVCMTRFEILDQYKASINNIYSSLKTQPNLAINLYESFFKTMKLILKLSLINTKPIKGHIKLIIFSLVYLSILNEWIKDFSFNNEKTMAILDTRLSLIESFIIKAN